MASSHAEILQSLEGPILAAFWDSKGTLDEAIAAHEPKQVEKQFERILKQMQRNLVTNSPADLQQAVSRWTASLLGFGLTPRAVLRTVVRFGDLVVRIAREQTPPGPMTNLFLRDLVRLNFHITREIVAIYADEVAAFELEGQETIVSP